MDESPQTLDGFPAQMGITGQPSLWRLLARQARPAVVILLALTLLTGLVYPLAVTGIAHVAFPREAAGTLIEQGGKVVGSSLIGQAFAGPGYFWSRPSATSPFPYNAGASSGSNLGPLNPDLLSAIRERTTMLRESSGMPASEQVPADLVTASASGLDPHISPAAAAYQVTRVARARGMSEDQVRALVKSHTQDRQLSLFGERRVDVVELNLALDALVGARGSQ